MKILDIVKLVAFAFIFTYSSGALSLENGNISSSLNEIIALDSSELNASSCRPDGLTCNGFAGQCCGSCWQGICQNGGGSSCRFDGAACNGSAGQCCGSCWQGVCEGSGSSSCRPDGARCSGFAGECCGSCWRGICENDPA